MGQRYVSLSEGRTVIIGYDRPFRTLFAALYENDGDEPTRTVGYHPSEQLLSEPGVQHGPYPADIVVFERTLTEWGLTGEERERCGTELAADPDATLDAVYSGTGGV